MAGELQHRLIGRRVFLVLALLTTGVAPGRMSRLDSASGPAAAQAGEVGQTRVVEAATSTGRHGAYYLPRHHESRTLPLLVFFHGTGGKGSLVTLRLRALAEQEGFIVLAPDSVSVAGVWTVGRGGDASEDRRHVMAGVREILGAPDVHIDVARVLAAGFSVGGNAAASIATHEALFTDLALLHGHMDSGTIGSRRPRTWVSAGERDRVRTVESMRSVAALLRQQSFSEVTLRVFPSGHTLQDSELAALVGWWLNR